MAFVKLLLLALTGHRTYLPMPECTCPECESGKVRGMAIFNQPPFRWDAEDRAVWNESHSDYLARVRW